MRFLRGFRDDENGGLAILFAFLMFSVTVLAGIGVDYGRALSARYDMQQALDAAVLAGVKYEVASRDTSAREYFNVSMTNPDADDVKVTFESPKQDTLTGRATAEVRTTLTGLLGVQSISIQTTAAAAASGGSPVCVLALSKTASQQLLVNSGADVVAPDCEVHAKSTASPVAIFNSGTKLDTKRICLAGSTIIDNGGTHPNVYKSCSTAEDPYAGKLPVPSSSSCTQSNGNYNGGSVFLTPGVYCGWFNFNNAPAVSFQPGVYVIKNGGWNVNGGTWTGNGVTFYFADQSKIQFNSAVAVTMSAPTSGTYAGIMMYEAANLGLSDFIFNDAKAMQLEGLIYLPSRNVTFNSGSSLTDRRFTLIINTLILNQTRWTLKPYSGGIGGGGGTKSVRLIQ